MRCTLHVASVSFATIQNWAGSAVSGVRAGSRAPQSIRCPRAPPFGWDSRAIVDEAGWGARFSQLVADGIVAEELPAATWPGERRPAEGMPAR